MPFSTVCRPINNTCTPIETKTENETTACCHCMYCEIKVTCVDTYPFSLYIGQPPVAEQTQMSLTESIKTFPYWLYHLLMIKNACNMLVT